MFLKHTERKVKQKQNLTHIRAIVPDVIIRWIQELRKEEKGGVHDPITQLIIEEEQTTWKIRYSNVGML